MSEVTEILWFRLQLKIIRNVTTTMKNIDKVKIFYNERTGLSVNSKIKDRIFYSFQFS